MTAESTSPAPQKKKRVSISEPPLPDTKSFHVQRRRVWRACESCRCALSPLPMTPLIHNPPLGERKSNVTATSLRVHSVSVQNPNVLGCRQRTELRSADSMSSATDLRVYSPLLIYRFPDMSKSWKPDSCRWKPYSIRLHLS
jgi:hypothetical protein